MANLDITLVDNKTIMIPDVTEEVVDNIKDWLYNGGDFYTLELSDTLSVINKNHVVRVTLY